MIKKDNEKIDKNNIQIKIKQKINKIMSNIKSRITIKLMFC